MDDKVTYWLDLAKYDIESAKVMQKVAGTCMLILCAIKPSKKR